MTATEREPDIEKANALEDAGLFRQALVKWKEMVAREADAISLCRLGPYFGSKIGRFTTTDPAYTI